jgi:hypothetical protein
MQGNPGRRGYHSEESARKTDEFGPWRDHHPHHRALPSMPSSTLWDSAAHKQARWVPGGAREI